MLLFTAFCPRANAIVGAVTPFICYEAEAGTLGGSANIVSVTVSPTTQFSSPQLEASGHAYVQLTNTGDYVEWTNNTGQAITALNLRSCIPDAPTGGGITSTIDLYVDGVFRQAFSVNSLQNYCYEGTNYNGQTDKNPADGDPRGFWNDTRAFITGAAVAQGSTIRFQKDSTNSAAFYYIDVVDLETPPPPLGQPANSLSIILYGAVSNNISVDNTSAINTCFANAKSSGKIAWIPPGTFYFSAVNGGLNASGITIQGAGAWYSTLYRVVPASNSQGVANMITTTSSALQDVTLDCNASSRASNNNNGAVNFSGTNWLVNRVWIQHATSAFWCAGVGGSAQNCRVLSVWSDGGNFNNVQSADGIGMNLMYSNNFVRGTGDDAMAINSVNYNVNGSTTNFYTMMSNIMYINNTAIAPWGGKCMGIYGGINDVVTNNFLCDTARYIGLGVMKFGVNGSDLLSATVVGNTVLRCGGNGYNQQQQAMMIGNGGDGQGVGTIANAYCASNIIINALYDAVGFSTSSNIVFQYNTITSPALDAIAAGPPDLGTAVRGTAIINGNTVTGLKVGKFAITNNAIAYALIIPIAAGSYNSMSGVTTETCAEGGQDVTSIDPGDWTAYNGVNLTNSSAFVARVACAGPGGSIEIHLDSTNGILIGTCAISPTGGAQVYSNVYCNLAGTAGSHTVYLVYTGAGSSLFNVQWIGFFAAPPGLSHQLIVGNTYSLKALVNAKYVTAPNGGTSSLIATSTAVTTAEQFKVYSAGGGNIGFTALANNKYVAAHNSGASPLIAESAAIGSWETFTEVDAGGGNIGLLAVVNGRYVTAPNGGTSALIAKSTTVGTAESFMFSFVSGVPPTPPGTLTAVPGPAQVALNWSASPGATGYNVKQSTTNGGPYSVVASNVNGLTYTSTNLPNGTTFYYVISALNPAGEGTNSGQAIGIPGTLNRAGWVPSALVSDSGGPPPNAIDNNISSRWATGAQQANGQWFQVDMGSVNTFYRLTLDAATSSTDYPRGYQVNVSNDGVSWGNPIASGAGNSALTTINFPTNSARYIRVTQTGSASGTWWSIYEFNLYGVAGTPPLAPSGLGALAGDAQAFLSWNTVTNATGYNLKRSSASNGVYSAIATNLASATYTNAALTNGLTYYYAVSALNPAGESSNSVPVRSQPTSATPLPVNFVANGTALQFNWPADHIGWMLQVQTNSANGLGSNWVTLSASAATNQMLLPIDPTAGSVFFRLIHP